MASNPTVEMADADANTNADSNPTQKRDEVIRLIVTNPSNDLIYLEPVVDDEGKIQERAMIPSTTTATSAISAVKPAALLKEICQIYLKYYPDSKVFNEADYRDSLLLDYDKEIPNSKVTSIRIKDYKNINICKKFINASTTTNKPEFELVLFEDSTFLFTWDLSQFLHLIKHMTYDESDVESISKFLINFITALYFTGSIIFKGKTSSSHELILNSLFNTHPFILKTMLTNKKINADPLLANLYKVELKRMLLEKGFKFNLESTIKIFARDPFETVVRELPNMDLKTPRASLIKEVIKNDAGRPNDKNVELLEIIFKNFPENA